MVTSREVVGSSESVGEGISSERRPNRAIHWAPVWPGIPGREEVPKGNYWFGKAGLGRRGLRKIGPTAGSEGQLVHSAEFPLGLSFPLGFQPVPPGWPWPKFRLSGWNLELAGMGG